jgi:hypothetical protein
MGSEGNVSKNGEPALGFCFTTVLQHTGHFGQRFLRKEQCDNTGESSINTHLTLAYFCLFLRVKSALTEEAFVLLLKLLK